MRMEVDAGSVLRTMATLLSVFFVVSGNAAAQTSPNAGSPMSTFTISINQAYGFLFSAFSSPTVAAVLQHIGDACGWARVYILVPALRVTIAVCLVMLAMQITEKLFVCAISIYVKVFRRTPEKVYNWKPIEEDVEKGDGAYPMVLVQIPMYNEKEVYQLSIGAACQLSWPRDRFIIQVLDDSTDVSIKELVKAECRKWAEAGMNIKYEVRGNRNGYKAGALKEGMKHSYVQQCEYIAMFDADFQPEPDFLQRTIPFLVYNPQLALVQSRWKFVNATECLMTRMQEMSLNYHFKVEQEGGSGSFAFFGYNGTAGVWRIAAIYDAGGWNDRTTVEDMDLAVRAGLKGWKFVYVGDVKVKSELPSTFKAYRFQQHRWSCGPANLFRKMAKVSFLMKFYLIYYFFFLGKIVAHTLTFIFFCTVIPISVLAPEVDIPQWGLIYVPLIITICKAIETPRSLHLSVFWVLFENAMSFHRLKAAMTGLLEAGRVNEWIVTEKLGDAHKVKPSGEDIDKATKQGTIHEVLLPPIGTPKMAINRVWKRFHLAEIGVGVLLMSCGFYDIFVSKKGYFVYIILQGIAFLVIGFDYVGTHIPTS
ncbi:hypothetical protein Taro_051967 [Colocasia esculenta]|uniref:glucomannan 4-beta-mannosyltransferase n=1 Tax=Colocasia esculenta TaxID=4460 RepID=A0A843XIU6_COLES|nr:hypothetical protein [Colocasia esculenta]